MDTNNGPLTPPHERYEKTVTPGKEENEVSKKGKCMRPLLLGKTLIGVGVFLVLFGILYGTVLPKVIDDKVNDGVVTCNAKDGAKTKYVDAYGDCDGCTPYYYNLYMFNVTNAEVHLATNAKLQLQEVGPYAYRRRQMRVDVSFDDNNRVSFKQYTYHTFEPSLSCEGCSDQDTVIGYNIGYMSTIAQAGGERAFLTRLARGSFARSNSTGLDETIRTSGTQMMRWVNGLNSFDPVALQTVSPRVLNFLLTGPTAIEDLVLEGFAYNGIFATRTISQWALGYPSMLAGIGLASNYNNVCVTGGMNDRCAACVGNEGTAACLQIWNECRKCTSGARVLALNNVTCGQLKNIYAATHGAEAAETWASGTCGLCSSSIPLCAAPLPGIVERSGLDFSKTPPTSSSLRTFVMPKQESLYDANGVLHPEYDERFTTYMDVEAGTGKTMRARRRLQASYAMSYSIADPTVVMSDVLWPNLTAEVVAPAYHGEESATITSNRVSSYKTIRNILRSIIPMLIIGIVLGLALAIYGVVYYRRAVAAAASTKLAANDV
uniref:Uncharacterized protein n=2 Tax=Globisporangium ultimum (strain ATCC 200006 / CBS 805.95 / DAOM BR144) TaxID=431595 RepID=K3W749_GLOUD